MNNPPGFSGRVTGIVLCYKLILHYLDTYIPVAVFISKIDSVSSRGSSTKIDLEEFFTATREFLAVYQLTN